jgi:two-component system phosphate regulon response regulator PhoB
VASVLLVNGTPGERETYAVHLRNHGYGTVEAASAQDALHIARRMLPTIIVTDMVLRGDPSGLDLLVQLKADERTRTIPVIMLTGHVFEIDRVEAARAGADLFLAKPCPAAHLASEIEHLLAPAPAAAGPRRNHKRR